MADWSLFRLLRFATFANLSALARAALAYVTAENTIVAYDGTEWHRIPSVPASKANNAAAGRFDWEATALAPMMRDSAGRAQVAAPSAAGDIARKAEVDAEATLARNADNLASGTVNLARIPATLTGKNADQVDGYHAGNASGNVPVSNGTVNTDLNADMLDGLHATSFTSAEFTVASSNVTLGAISVNQVRIALIGASGGIRAVYLPAGGTYAYMLIEQTTIGWGTGENYGTASVATAAQSYLSRAGGSQIANVTTNHVFMVVYKRLS